MNLYNVLLSLWRNANNFIVGTYFIKKSICYTYTIALVIFLLGVFGGETPTEILCFHLMNFLGFL